MNQSDSSGANLFSDVASKVVRGVAAFVGGAVIGGIVASIISTTPGLMILAPVAPYIGVCVGGIIGGAISSGGFGGVADSIANCVLGVIGKFAIVGKISQDNITKFANGVINDVKRRL